MFTVTGFYQDKPYGLSVDPASRPHPTRGIVTGTTEVLALLVTHEGAEVSLTPTGPRITVRRDDAAAVLGALYALTDVVDVTGDGIPEVIPRAEDGVVY